MEEVIGALVSGIMPFVMIVFLIHLIGGILSRIFAPDRGQRRGRRGSRTDSRRTADEKGLDGENTINNLLAGTLDPCRYRVFSDLIVGSNGNTTQIDHVVVSQQGIFVIETKNYAGWIYGDPSQPQWTQTVFGKKSRFQNPLRQNYKHIKALEQVLGLPFECFKSIVAFAGDAEIKTVMPPNVIYSSEAVSYIENNEVCILSVCQAQRAAAVLESLRNSNDEAARRAHVDNLSRNHRPVGPGASAPPCPRCSSHMVLRRARNGSGPFWGCSSFPKCRGVRKCS